MTIGAPLNEDGPGMCDWSEFGALRMRGNQTVVGRLRVLGTLGSRPQTANDTKSIFKFRF